MGLNTKHDKSKDIASGYNLSRRCAFKFEPLNENATRNFEASQGLELNKLTRAIKVNGRCEISLKDRVRVLGSTFIVVAITSSFDNIEEMRYSEYVDNYSGGMIIGLE